MSPSTTSRSVTGIATTVPDVSRVVETLDRHGVEYLIVGGVAAHAYGATRPTGDFDCVVARATDNLDRLVGALRELNARLRVDRLADDEAAGLPFRIDTQTLLNSEIWTLRTDAGGARSARSTTTTAAGGSMVAVPVIDMAALRPDAQQVALVAGLLAEVGAASAAELSADLGLPVATVAAVLRVLERSGRAGRSAEGWEHVDTGPRPPRRSWRVGGTRTL